MTEFKSGDIITPKNTGASRLEVLDPILTSRGKLRMIRMDRPGRPETTAWWKTTDDLPKGYRHEPMP